MRSSAPTWTDCSRSAHEPPSPDPPRGRGPPRRHGRAARSRGGAGERGHGAGDRHRASLRRLPESLRRRLPIGDGEPDARHHPPAPGGRRNPGASEGLLRREVRALGPALAAEAGLQPPGLDRPLRGPRPGPRARGFQRAALEPPPGRRPRGNPRDGRRHPRPHPPRDGRHGPLMRQILPVILIALPGLLLVLWPLFRRGTEGWAATSTAPTSADDRRLELSEEKASVYRALKEIEFDHEAGHLSEEDYRPLRDRYESRAAALLHALDALGAEPGRKDERARPEAVAAPASRRRGWTHHPAVLAGGAALLLVFGVFLGLNIG